MRNAFKIIDAGHCKRLKKKLAGYGISVRTQKVQKADAILAHLQWRTLTLVNNFAQIRKQAESEFDINRELTGNTYIDKFVEECPANDGELSILETLDLFVQWCKIQGINYADLMLKMYCILNKEFPKSQLTHVASFQ